MRISGGSARGRVIKAPKGVDLRPTEERVRLALFNILASAVPDSSWLDLFCGTGAVGLEAISRGASRVTFGDKESRCIQNVEEHLRLFKFDPAGTELLRGDGLKLLEGLGRSKKRFDFVYIDPPYETDLGLQALRLVGELAILDEAPMARAIFEHPRKLEVPELVAGLSLLKQYPYGNTQLSFYAAHHAI